MIEVATKYCPNEVGVDEMLGLVGLQTVTLTKEVEKFTKERKE